ncbi:major capsid protein [Sulfurospirillum cavolei]|uniref:major capsid protein n=1 Tax=Sulfurospirillum cavolei TaxID=366522 RepID=UPI000764AB73|nr:major capsid protein [Sulfurospirillum cavolei]
MLKNLFSLAAVAVAIKQAPVLKTPIMDTFYPEDVRTQHPFATIGIDELIETIKAVPVVKRGTGAIGIGGDTGTIKFIEPLPVSVQKFLGADVLNNIKTLLANGQQEYVQTYVNSQVEFMRKTIRATMESLSGQSLSGKIAYAMKTDSGMETYEVDYGTVPTYAITKKWDAADATLQDIIDGLSEMAEQIAEDGFGENVDFYAGKKVFSKISSKISSLPNDARSDAKVVGSTILLGGYTIYRFVSTYYDPKTKKRVKAIDDKNIQAKSKDAAFAFKYLAIDDLDAGLQPLPLFVKTVKLDNPSGYNLIGNSKPLPIPVVKAMRIATAVS